MRKLVVTTFVTHLTRAGLLHHPDAGAGDAAMHLDAPGGELVGDDRRVRSSSVSAFSSTSYTAIAKASSTRASRRPADATRRR